LTVMATEESSFAPRSKPAAGQTRGRLPGVLASRKAKLRTALIVVGAIVIVFVIIPRIFHALHTVSTDDAYVNSYVTFVAPRVSGQVARVLVDDNNRVRKGDVLVELDPEPFRVQVAIKQAAVDTAQAELVTAQATVRSQIALCRTSWKTRRTNSPREQPNHVPERTSQ
jgi:membrane fusion protein, multidrug efflux system